jgi:Spy/CpxP family protein refolding chaperone
LSDAGILNDTKLNQEVSSFIQSRTIFSSLNLTIFQVTKLRNVAKKSKGKIIQSMIRKARKLQKATESNPKNLKKAENLLEIVSGLKVIYYFLT